MKKLFIAALALTAFTACSQDELVEQQQLSNAIAFDGAFVENATRAADDPSTTTDGPNAIKEISVWGFINEVGGDVFNEEKVTKGDNGWTYVNTQYWIPGNDYYFAAISPVADSNVKVKVANTTDALKLGLGEVTFTNEDGTTDLLYDAKTASTKNMKAGAEMDKVKFTMNHLLSKVKFSFTNGFKNENNTLVVKNIQMVVPGEGTINLATADWWKDETATKWTLTENKTTTLSFGHIQAGSKVAIGETAECDVERLTIPAAATQKYTVTFDVELYSGSVLAYSRTLTTTIEGAQLRIGYAYNFKATLDHTNIAEDTLEPIVFDVVSVKGWMDGNGYDKNIIQTSVAEVASAADLAAAMADGATSFRLVGDNNITETLKFSNTATTGGRNATLAEYVLDLNGKTIDVPASDAIVVDGVKLTINGDGEVKAATGTTGRTSGNAVWAYNGGTVIINDGKYYVGDDPTNIGNTRNDCIYAGSTQLQTAGYIYIYGGEFSVEEVETNKYNNQYWVLNLSDRTNSNIQVYGGKFKNFDPSVNKSENPAMNFVAAGYGVEVEGEYYTVKELPAVTVSVAAGATQTLNSDVVIKGSVKVEGTLDGGDSGYTLFAAAEPTNNGLIRPEGSSATVKNVTIDGANRYATGEYSLRAIYITKAGTYNIENVTTTGTGYALNVSTTAAVTLNVKNSVFEGWTSYGTSTTATFTGVEFTRGSYFTNADQNGYFRPYGTTILENCNFELGYIIDFGSLGEGKTVTFKNCKYNGVALTAENIPTIWENYLAKKASIIFETASSSEDAE